MNFHVGQKVVCVDDRGWNGAAISLPVKGEVCTVRGFSKSALGIWLLLEEHRSGTTFPFTGEERGFMPERFRPVKTTSIELFRAMLVNPPREIVGA